MATSFKKSHTRSAEPVAPKRSRALPVLLATSVAVNAVLGAWALQGRSKKDKGTADVSSSAVQRSLAAEHTTEASLPPQLLPYAALGSFLAENNQIPALKWNEDQFRAFERGVRATYEGHSYPLDEKGVKLRDEISAKVQALLAANPSDSVEDYFRTLREKEGVQRSTTGLHYRITQEGYGEKPGPESIVVASYGGRLPGGQAIPSLTRARVRTAVRDLLPGLGEGVQLLNPGGKALVYLSPALSFRDGQWPADVPKGAPIILFLELHAVE